MRISEQELKEMIREVVPHVARELLEQMDEEEPDVGDPVEVVGTSMQGKIEEKSRDNRYWVSFENKEGGDFFEPRHVRIIEDESKEQ